MSEDSLEKLKMKFDDDVKNAIHYCESLICKDKYENIEKFSAAIQAKQKCHICTYSWSQPTLVVQCKDCGIDKMSAICVNCFNKGHHEGHDYTYCITPKGMCDCGDKSAWKKEGFCCDHAYSEQKTSEILTTEQENLLVKIFTAAIHNIKLLSIYKQQEFLMIADWLLVFSRISDEIRHCIAVAFLSNFDLADFLLQAPNMGYKASESVYNLISLLYIDPLFREAFTDISFSIYPKFVYMFLRLGSVPSFDVNNPPLYQLKTISFLFDQSFSMQGIKRTRDKPINWTQMLEDSFPIIFDSITKSYSSSMFKKSNMNLIFKNFGKIIDHFRKVDNQKENFVKLSLLLTNEIYAKEGALATSRAFGEKMDDSRESHFTLLSLTVYLSTFALKISKTNFFIPDVLDAFFKFIKCKFILEEGDRFDPAQEVNDIVAPVFFRSVFSKNVNTSLSLSLHVFTACMLIRQGDNLKNIFSEFAKSNNIHIDFACIFAALLPLRLMAVSVLTAKHFVRNSSSFIRANSSLVYKNNVKTRFVPLFALIQMLFGITEAKDMFIGMIARTFGLFLDDDMPELKKEMEFSFIHFITCLLYDRICINLDFKRLKKAHILHSLKLSPQQLSKATNQLWFDVSSNKEFLTDLFQYVTRESTETGTIIRLNSSYHWHPFLPWLKYNEIMDSISYCLSHNPDSTIPFPIFENEPFGLDLRSGFSAPSLLAIEYHLLSNSSVNETISETIHIVICLIRSFGKISDHDDKKPENLQPIIANDLDDLIIKIPHNFMEFMYTEITYKGRESNSIVTLIQKFGKIGENVLIDMNIGFIPATQNVKDELILRSHKMKARLAKERAMKEFQSQIKAFSSGFDSEEEIDVCTICSSPEGVLAYPIYAYKSLLPGIAERVASGLPHSKKRFYKNIQPNISKSTTSFSTLSNSLPTCSLDASMPTSEYEGNLTIYTSFKLCVHPVHLECINFKQNFQCPICRGKRNHLLPILPNFKSYQKSFFQIQEFINKVFNHLIYDTADMIRSIAGHISLSEIRFRLKPDFIDQPAFKALTKNLFMNIWSFYQVEIFDDQIPTNDLTEILIIELIKSNDPPSIFKVTVKNLVDKYANRNTPLQILEFLRRSAIIEHFCLNVEFKNVNGFYNWDKLLSAKTLKKRYNVNCEDCTNQLLDFGFIDIPSEFIKLQAPPYNIDISDQKFETAICLLTGEKIKLSAKAPIPYLTLKDYIEKCLASTFTPLLFLSGRSATSVMIYHNEFRKFFKMPDIYLDMFGEGDVGIKRGSPLKLSYDRLLRIIESLLSGDWIDTNSELF